MKILFVLGFANLFAGAGWTRIGFFADQWPRKGHMIEILGAFSYKAFSKRGVKRLNNIKHFQTRLQHGFVASINLYFKHPHFIRNFNTRTTRESPQMLQ